MQADNRKYNPARSPSGKNFSRIVLDNRKLLTSWTSSTLRQAPKCIGTRKNKNGKGLPVWTKRKKGEPSSLLVAIVVLLRHCRALLLSYDCSYYVL